MKNRLGLDPHARYRELLAARLDRQLTRAENRLLVGHLKACLDCQQAERDYRAQGSLLRSMSTPIPPRDMWARTSTALDREVARWSHRYPRFGRRAIARSNGNRSGASGALATVVAALGVVTAVAVLQLAPALRPAPVPEVGTGALVAALRPTPFAVAPQLISFFAAGETDLSVYQTSIDQVCPQSTPDCSDDKVFLRRNVTLPSNMRPQNIALSPNGAQIAFVGHDADQDVIAVVMLQNAPPPSRGGGSGRSPDRPAEPTPTSSASLAAATPANPVEESPSIEPTESEPVDSSPLPTDTMPATPDVPDPDPTATAETTQEPEQSSEPPTATPSETPPASVVPGLTVMSILEDVHSAGAPPAWSRDGEILAFSAMPADGSHGPDVYIWRPGDGQAQAITSDHASYFASWSGRRIVASRINQTPGKSDSADVLTMVIDPVSLEERRVRGPKMWLPVVDPERAYAIVWHGTLDLSGDLPAVVEGALYVADWAALDPFGPEAATPEAATDAPSTELVAIDPARDPAVTPVIDWHVRWSANGLVLGVWEADAPGGSWGELRLLVFDPEFGRLSFDEPLVELQFAKRGFTLGVDRVAWVGPSEDGMEGVLRVRTWGADGMGDLRIDTVNLQELMPSF